MNCWSACNPRAPVTTRIGGAQGATRRTHQAEVLAGMAAVLVEDAGEREALHLAQAAHQAARAVLRRPRRAKRNRSVAAPQQAARGQPHLALVAVNEDGMVLGIWARPPSQCARRASSGCRRTEHHGQRTGDGLFGDHQERLLPPARARRPP
jgi:hypothetical protein